MPPGLQGLLTRSRETHRSERKWRRRIRLSDKPMSLLVTHSSVPDRRSAGQRGAGGLSSHGPVLAKGARRPLFHTCGCSSARSPATRDVTRATALLQYAPRPPVQPGGRRCAVSAIVPDSPIHACPATSEAAVPLNPVDSAPTGTKRNSRSRQNRRKPVPPIAPTFWPLVV
jgi:hypothetical protein